MNLLTDVSQKYSQRSFYFLCLDLNEKDNDEMEVEDETKKIKAQMELDAFTLKKREEMKLIEAEANLLRMELKKKYDDLESIQANNAALKKQLRVDADKEVERMRMQLIQTKFEWEHKLKEECDDKQLKHMEVMNNMRKEQEAEYKRMREMKQAHETEFKRLQDEMKYNQEAEYKRLKDDLAKKTLELDTNHVIPKDDHDPQYGIRNRKSSSPRDKLTVTKSNVGTRSLQKVTKLSSTGKKIKSNLIPTTSPRSKSNVISNTIPIVEDYNPTTHDEGHEYLWKGEKEANAFQNVASFGLKLVSDTAAHFIPDMFSTDAPKTALNDGFKAHMGLGDAPKTALNDGFEAHMGLGNPSFSEDEDDNEFESVSL
jgi:hypothetical protein